MVFFLKPPLVVIYLFIQVLVVRKLQCVLVTPKPNAQKGKQNIKTPEKERETTVKKNKTSKQKISSKKTKRK